MGRTRTEWEKREGTKKEGGRERERKQPLMKSEVSYKQITLYFRFFHVNVFTEHRLWVTEVSISTPGKSEIVPNLVLKGNKLKRTLNMKEEVPGSYVYCWALAAKLYPERGLIVG